MPRNLHLGASTLRNRIRITNKTCVKSTRADALLIIILRTRSLELMQRTLKSSDFFFYAIALGSSSLSAP
jgi:hypothetical protein